MRRGIGTRRVCGYTLLEVLVALVLLAIVLPAIGFMMSGSRKSSLANYNAEQAASVAQLVVDSLGMIPLSQLSALSGVYQTRIGLETYSVDWTVVADAGRNVGEVTATVSWLQGNRTHSMALRGVIR